MSGAGAGAVEPLDPVFLRALELVESGLRQRLVDAWVQCLWAAAGSESHRQRLPTGRPAGPAVRFESRCLHVQHELSQARYRAARKFVRRLLVDYTLLLCEEGVLTSTEEERRRVRRVLW